MKQVLAVTILLVSCLFISACQQKHESKSSGTIDTVAIKASIDSVGAVVQKGHDLGDFEMLAMTWAKDGIMSSAGNPPVFGRDAIIAAMKKMPAPPPGGTMKIYPIDIKVLSREWAYVFGIDSLKYTPPGAPKQMVETFTFYVLVKKTSEGWQTYREMVSPNQAMGNPPK